MKCDGCGKPDDPGVIFYGIGSKYLCGDCWDASAPPRPRTITAAPIRRSAFYEVPADKFTFAEGLKGNAQLAGFLRQLADTVEAAQRPITARVNRKFNEPILERGRLEGIEHSLSIDLTEPVTKEEAYFGSSPVRAAMQSFDELRQLQDDLIASLGVPPHLVAFDRAAFERDRRERRVADESGVVICQDCREPIIKTEPKFLRVGLLVGQFICLACHQGRSLAYAQEVAAQRTLEVIDPPACTCDIMLTGCVCGAMQREREKAG